MKNSMVGRLLVVLVVMLSSLAAIGEEPPQPGELAPDFALRDTDGELVRLSAVVGEHPTVLVFYRGHW